MDMFVRQSERLARGLPDEDRGFPLSSIAMVLVETGKFMVESDPDRAAGDARAAERIVRQAPDILLPAVIRRGTRSQCSASTRCREKPSPRATVALRLSWRTFTVGPRPAG
ncbi:hypothetical protein ACF05T_20895 [Streptomyces lateritius]|uniref:Uncharacterized protein n=1 Tax=Streptomyces lateritius TaxID=67313 RepID=A0ABW6YFB6_9ACTN